MEKRRLTSLRSVLLQYLVRTALACLLVAVGWLLVLLLWIQNSGLFLPANQAAQACQKAAQDVLPGMTAATFDETQLDSLCRYALFAAPDSSEVLATNMDAGHLQRAMENRQGKTRWHFGYTQYYMTSKLQDGTVCLLQFDYAVPYADPALRGVLPDMQTVHCMHRKKWKTWIWLLLCMRKIRKQNPLHLRMFYARIGFDMKRRRTGLLPCRDRQEYGVTD